MIYFAYGSALKVMYKLRLNARRLLSLAVAIVCSHQRLNNSFRNWFTPFCYKICCTGSTIYTFILPAVLNSDIKSNNNLSMCYLYIIYTCIICVIRVWEYDKRINNLKWSPILIFSLIHCFTSSTNSSDLLWSHQQQLCDGGGGGHGVSVHSMDLESTRHAPHPLVGGQDLLITKQNPVWVFDWGGGKSEEKMEDGIMKMRKKQAHREM